MKKQLKRISLEKETFMLIFLILVLLLMFMPFITTFNDVLTRIVMLSDSYKIIQNFVVPWEVRMVGVILYPFGFKPAIAGEYLAINSGSGGTGPFLIEIAWNCIGWQSLLFFMITTFVGLQGDKYTNLSKFKVLVIGFLGTFLVNLARITAVTLVAFYFGQNIAFIFHDYSSTLIVIAWLFCFWWFAYGFVLEEK